MTNDDERVLRSLAAISALLWLKFDCDRLNVLRCFACTGFLDESLNEEGGFRYD